MDSKWFVNMVIILDEYFRSVFYRDDELSGSSVDLLFISFISW